ncbi:MAG: dihydropteroate synthase [Elusimicrobiota bacterium]|jgi:dihydropteroate synthase|nr:dihydropteroate synthase [Elusimicrobiota bacterium]
MLIRKAVLNDYEDALKLIAYTNANKESYNILAKKAVSAAIIIENIDNKAAAILKQEALSCGAELSVSFKVGDFQKGKSNAVLFVTMRELEILSNKLILQPFGLKEAAAEFKKINQSLSVKKVFKYKNSSLALSKPAVMGIINVDPNSFSGDGLKDYNEAAQRAVYFEQLGAKIIDLGAESSRPGSKPIDYKLEIKRLIPALKQIRKKVKIPISIDTYKYETAKAAISEGADIINDIFALKIGKDKLAKLIADSKAGLILMHSKGVPLTMQNKALYRNCPSEVYDFLSKRKEYAMSLGIKEDFISIDPGIGFAKTIEHNLQLINNLKIFSALGPVTAGVSRKSFVRKLAGEQTIHFAAANFLAVIKGADIIRVHDVKETIDILKLL